MDALAVGFRRRRLAGSTRPISGSGGERSRPGIEEISQGAQGSDIARLLSNEHFGFWLPTRRSVIGGVQAMAYNLAKVSAAMTVLEESHYPYLDQNVIEFVLATPADQWLRPGERRSLMRRALAGIVPAEILARRSKQFAARTPAVMLDQHWGEIQSRLLRVDQFKARICGRC